MERKDSQDASRNVGRIMGIVEALAAEADRGLRLADVMRATGLNKTTAHRLLAGLAAHGLADQDSETGRYFVGVRLIALASAAKRRFQLAPLVEHTLAGLGRQTDDTVMLSARVGDEALCLECHEGGFPIKVLTLRTGDRRPLGIGAPGIALLAFLPDAEVDRVLSANAAERAEFPFDEIQIRQMIVEARKHGYAYNDVHVFKGMETITDMAAVSVPICATSGTPVAALSITAITQRLAPPRRDNIVAALRREVAAIEAAYRPILDEMEPRSAPAGRQRAGAAAAETETAQTQQGAMRMVS
jgi:DNA-binding IclR family transcriptional regulator